MFLVEEIEKLFTRCELETRYSKINQKGIFAEYILNNKELHRYKDWILECARATTFLSLRLAFFSDGVDLGYGQQPSSLQKKYTLRNTSDELVRRQQALDKLCVLVYASNLYEDSTQLTALIEEWRGIRDAQSGTRTHMS